MYSNWWWNTKGRKLKELYTSIAPDRTGMRTCDKGTLPVVENTPGFEDCFLRAEQQVTSTFSYSVGWDKRPLSSYNTEREGACLVLSDFWNLQRTSFILKYIFSHDLVVFHYLSSLPILLFSSIVKYEVCYSIYLSISISMYLYRSIYLLQCLYVLVYIHFCKVRLIYWR